MRGHRNQQIRPSSAVAPEYGLRSTDPMAGRAPTAGVRQGLQREGPGPRHGGTKAAPEASEASAVPGGNAGSRRGRGLLRAQAPGAGERRPGHAASG